MADEPQREKEFAEKRRLVAELKGKERRRKKRIFLLFLLLLLILLLALFYWFGRKKELPLPTIEMAQAERVLPPDPLFFFDGSPDHRLRRPTDVEVNPKNRLVYVTDSFNSRISVFDTDGNFQFTFDKLDKGKKLKRPLYLAFDSKGNVWVTDRQWQKIFVFTENGKFIKEFVPKNIDRNRWQPNAIFIDKRDNIYISEIEKTHRIQVFSPDGKLLVEFGKVGSATEIEQKPGVFAFPNGIAVDEKYIYITDSTNRRVQVFTRDGKFVRIIPTGGNPRGIAIGYMDRLHIVDSPGHNVLVYSKDGNFLTQFGSVGSELGQTFYPNGIGTDGRRIYVADTWNHRIDVWAWRPAVVTPPIARRLLPWWWLLLPLLLLPLLFRRRKNIATRDFIDRAINEGKLSIVKKELKCLYVSRVLYEDFKELEIDGIKMGDFLKVGDYKERYLEEIKEVDPSLPAEVQETLAMARTKRRRKRLFTESEELRYVADEFKVKNYNFDEFLEMYGYEREEGVKSES